MKKAYYFSFLLLTILFVNCKTQQSSVKVLTPNEFKDALKNTDIQLVDVRTYVEFDEGHIEGAKNIDYLADDFEAQMSKLDRDKPIYIYCASGGRSEVTSSMLHEMGFKDINDLSGGYIAWKKMK